MKPYMIYFVYILILLFKGVERFFESHPRLLLHRTMFANGIKHEHIRYCHDAFRSVGIEENAFSNNALCLWRCA